MIHLSLTQEEENTLIDLVDACLADLRVEIGKTDDWTYRQMLHERESVLTRLLSALQHAEDGVMKPNATEVARPPLDRKRVEPASMPVDE